MVKLNGGSAKISESHWQLVAVKKQQLNIVSNRFFPKIIILLLLVIKKKKKKILLLKQTFYFNAGLEKIHQQLINSSAKLQTIKCSLDAGCSVIK